MAKKNPSISLPKTNKPKKTQAKGHKKMAAALKEMREILGDITADIILDDTLISTKTLDDLNKDKTVQQETLPLKDKAPTRKKMNTKNGKKTRSSNTSGGKSYT
tara:strand:- start:154 stop:465 length:312 start_codon:yes stop_codon:yes gene_type:complete